MLTIAPEMLAAATGGRLLQLGERAITAGLTTDSRALQAGCIFLALVGERFNGNSFAVQAAQQGAAALVLSEEPEGVDKDCSIILVDDTLAALQQLATWWRGQLGDITVVGLTGSCGKTSTKDMLAAILSQSMSSQATLGNLNNHIGVPLSILRAEQGLQAAIWEMGMNHAGEIAPLCAMTQPHIGIITNVGSAHIEYLGTRQAIAEEKCALARALPLDGALIYPASDDFADYIPTQTRAQCIAVGGTDSPVRAENIQCHSKGSDFTLRIIGMGEIAIQLPVAGEHMVTNSLLAAAAASYTGCSLQDIAAGLATLAITKGRLSIQEVQGITLVDDSYNANLESMKAALKTVADIPCKGQRYAILGKMGELGEFALQAHRELGEQLNGMPYAALLTVGEDCPELQALNAAVTSMPSLHAESHELAAELLRDRIVTGDIILFKGSRSAHMERSMHALFPATK
ncbi:MAG: UDP-N-acetylmuramoyl-tripeptide--D-alanyl-D-alanine ligase [Akkermansia sp.]